MISRTNNVCHTLVFVMQSGSEEPHGFPSWCVSKCSSNSSSLAIATRFTTVIHERQKYPRFGTASLAFNMRSIAWIVLKRGTSLKLSSCSNRISGYFLRKKTKTYLTRGLAIYFLVKAHLTWEMHKRKLPRALEEILIPVQFAIVDRNKCGWLQGSKDEYW